MDAGIEAKQRSYLTYDMPASRVPASPSGGGGPSAHVAVLVHYRDQDVAIRIAEQLNQVLELERQERERNLPPVSDEELEREALDAGPPPEP